MVYARLNMDMPSRCADCRFVEKYDYNYRYVYGCSLDGDVVIDDPYEGRGLHCPMRPLDFNEKTASEGEARNE